MTDIIAVDIFLQIFDLIRKLIMPTYISVNQCPHHCNRWMRSIQWHSDSM